MIDLNNKVAIVTGGAQGLGAATSYALSQRGVTVVCGDIDKVKAQNTVDSIMQEDCQAYALELDVSEQQSVEAAVKEVMDKFGRIDFLINNAGTDRTVPFDELTVADWNRVIGVNLNGAFLMAKAVLPELYKQGSGHIINIVSTAGKRVWGNAAAYHASKWGLLGLSHALFVEAREHNVKVSAVVAGGMRTGFILDRFPDTPLQNLQDPANVAETIAFVLSQPAETIIPEVLVLPLNETSWP
jgi:NAD(P)-dependent dehydrogenase (short-subunit alcohol dehydrogenase family)